MRIEGIFYERSSSAFWGRVIIVVRAIDLKEKAEFGDNSDLALRTENDVTRTDNSWFLLWIDFHPL